MIFISFLELEVPSGAFFKRVISCEVFATEETFHRPNEIKKFLPHHPTLDQHHLCYTMYVWVFDIEFTV